MHTKASTRYPSRKPPQATAATRTSPADKRKKQDKWRRHTATQGKPRLRHTSTWRFSKWKHVKRPSLKPMSRNHALYPTLAMRPKVLPAPVHQALAAIKFQAPSCPSQIPPSKTAVTGRRNPAVPPRPAPDARYPDRTYSSRNLLETTLNHAPPTERRAASRPAPAAPSSAAHTRLNHWRRRGAANQRRRWLPMAA